MEEISEDVKENVVKFQTYQQQLQSILIQRESLRLQSFEVERALEELEKTNQENAYKIAGQIMILKSVDELKKELNRTKEDIKVRVNSLEKMEKKITDRLKELQEKLKDVIK
ncbi:MAG: prefoldin subunit beta [Candidatus Aenigmarchaeota archaeon]|nr:prefoldin subunit beta [Candidatus Aenigmarchaeota archaeon]